MPGHARPRQVAAIAQLRDGVEIDGEIGHGRPPYTFAMRGQLARSLRPCRSSPAAPAGPRAARRRRRSTTIRPMPDKGERIGQRAEDDEARDQRPDRRGVDERRHGGHLADAEGEKDTEMAHRQEHAATQHQEDEPQIRHHEILEQQHRDHRSREHHRSCPAPTATTSPGISALTFRPTRSRAAEQQAAPQAEQRERGEAAAPRLRDKQRPDESEADQRDLQPADARPQKPHRDHRQENRRELA